MSINLGKCGTSIVQDVPSFDTEDKKQLFYGENSSIFNSSNEEDLDSFLNIFEEEEKDLEAFLEEITTPLDLKLPTKITDQVETELDCKNQSVHQKFLDLNDYKSTPPCKQNFSNIQTQSRFCPLLCYFQNQCQHNSCGEKFDQMRQKSSMAVEDQRILQQKYQQQQKFNQFQLENMIRAEKQQYQIQRCQSTNQIHRYPPQYFNNAPISQSYQNQSQNSVSQYSHQQQLQHLYTQPAMEQSMTRGHGPFKPIITPYPQSLQPPIPFPPTPTPTPPPLSAKCQNFQSANPTPTPSPPPPPAQCQNPQSTDPTPTPAVLAPNPITSTLAPTPIHVPADITTPTPVTPAPLDISRGVGVRAKRGYKKDSCKNAQSHSFVEKQRRDRINLLIDELREIIPPNQQLAEKFDLTDAISLRPKHVVLTDTINWVKSMSAKIEKMENQIQYMKHGGDEVIGDQGINVEGDEGIANKLNQASQTIAPQKLYRNINNQNSQNGCYDVTHLPQQDSCQKQNGQFLYELQMDNNCGNNIITKLNNSNILQASHFNQLPCVFREGVSLVKNNYKKYGVFVEPVLNNVLCALHVQIICRDRQGLLFDIIRCFCSMLAEIKWANISTDPYTSTANNVFEIVGVGNDDVSREYVKQCVFQSVFIEQYDDHDFRDFKRQRTDSGDLTGNIERIDFDF